jgi:hypothetical protein
MDVYGGCPLEIIMSRIMSRRDVKFGVMASLAATVLYSIFANTYLALVSITRSTTTDLAFQGRNNIQSSTYKEYLPASSEKYVRDHALQLGYDNEQAPAHTCSIWTDDTNVTVPTSIHDDLTAFRQELVEYNRLVKAFQPISDLRKQLALDESNIDQVCQQVDMDMKALFSSQQLSMGTSGLMEPLLPPFRHSDFCFKGTRSALMDLSFLVHDFGAMCRKLKHNSRTVLIDMGASLDFHFHGTENPITAAPPAIYLTELYRQFGFSFDHIYAHEVTLTHPQHVFQNVPDHMRAAYHWMNVGVDADPTSSLNPFKMLLENFNEDDFIVVKLDIDTGSIENPLAQQLLHNTALHGLVDQFYFEHHVMLGELAPNWGDTMQGSVQSSLELFIGLREAGVAAHSWV